MVARSFEVSPKNPLVAVKISSCVYLSVVFSCAASGIGRLDASSTSGAVAANRRRDSNVIGLPLLSVFACHDTAADEDRRRRAQAAWYGRRCRRVRRGIQRRSILLVPAPATYLSLVRRIFPPISLSRRGFGDSLKYIKILPLLIFGEEV